jgi:hypothetical protein
MAGGTNPRRLRLLKLSALLAVFFVLVLSSHAQSRSGNAAPCAIEYWVAPGGNDSWSGSTLSPFMTLDRARLEVRNHKSRGACTIEVNLRGGVYRLTAPLHFDSMDSGAPRAEVVYQAAPGNTSPVIISGGIKVTGFSCAPSNICTATVPDLPTGVMPRQFYVNGRRAIRARTNPGQPANPDYTRESYGYLQSVPQVLTHPELVEAVTATQWKMMRCPVAFMVGPALLMQEPCWTNANSYQSPWNFQLLSWLENAPEFLTQPNMWYLDPYTRQLSYYGDGSGGPANAILPILEALVELEGSPLRPVSNITFKGLQFSYATWLAPELQQWLRLRPERQSLERFRLRE